jgi:hypothetical protein
MFGRKASWYCRVMDRYGTDVLAAGRRKSRSTKHPAGLGMVVEDVESG